MQKSLPFQTSESLAQEYENLCPVIIHFDMDCFYCQVEEVRLGIDGTKVPVAVQQWETVIAVNYVARRMGVTRHALYKECFKSCENLKLIHVPTFSLNNPGAEAFRHPPTDINSAVTLDRTIYKASLQPYREASIKVFETIKKGLERYKRPFILEKASVDEVFVDISEIVDLVLEEEYGVKVHKGKIPKNIKVDHVALDWEKCGKPAISGSTDSTNKLDELRVYIGCRIALEIRQLVFEGLKYTISAGIAHNKTLAKLASAENKPNQQTFVLKSHVSEWMKRVPFRKIRFMGGKLGNLLMKIRGKTSYDDSDDEEKEVEGDSDEDNAEKDTNVIMASDLWYLSKDELTKKLGDAESANWVYGVIRGHDTSSVAPRLHTKSFMSAKELRPSIKDWRLLKDWIFLLLNELIGRALEDFLLYQRWPNSIILSFKRPQEKARSKVMEFPFSKDQFPEKLADLVELCVNQLVNENKSSPILPCSRLTLSVTKFAKVTDRDKGNLRIDEFIKATPTPNPTEALTSIPFKPRNQKNLLDYFQRPKDTEKHDTEYICPKCNTRFEEFDASARIEHEDFHFALELQKSLDDTV